MSDTKKNFHEIAIQSSLFKGRSDWYFCFLKSERIAHVLTVLANRVSDERRGELATASRVAGLMPGTFVHFAAGTVSTELVLADLFTLLSSVRLLQTSGAILKENAIILAQECEALIEKFMTSTRLSPFASLEDFAVPPIAQELPDVGLTQVSEAYTRPVSIKDNKGHAADKGQEAPKYISKGQQERLEQILDFVLKNKSVSIKDISKVVQGCSEKTIQRELGVLIQQGSIKKVGERRWSLYIPAV